jgi:hypothetical protein
MYRKHAFITVLGLGLGLTLAGAAAADELSDHVAAIPGAVEEVRLGGSWQEGDRTGSYRIVVARNGGERITARLFIQWIAYGAAGEATVEDSVEIKELAELGVDIVNFVSESDVDGLSVFVETANDAGGPGEGFELHVFSPTDYLFGPASN